jgi:hypothetical protein
MTKMFTLGRSLTKSLDSIPALPERTFAQHLLKVHIDKFIDSMKEEVMKLI